MTPREIAEALEKAHREGRFTNPYDSPLTSGVLVEQIATAATPAEAVQIAMAAGVSRIDLVTAGVDVDTIESEPPEPTEQQQLIEEASAASIQAAEQAAHKRAIEQAKMDPTLAYDVNTDTFYRFSNRYNPETGNAIYDIVEVDLHKFISSRGQELQFKTIDETPDGQNTYIEITDRAEFEDETSSEIPPMEGQATLIGNPPYGFVPGVGFQDPAEPLDMRQAEIDAALNRIESIRRGTALEPGTLVAGKTSFAHEIDDLNTFTDGGTMEARYYEGEQWMFSWRSANEIRILQERMERAGLLKPKSYIPGMWDPKSAASMQQLMLESNAVGVTWEMQLGRRLDNMTDELLSQIYGSGRSGSRQPFVAPAYLKPDNASLSQAVKTMVRGRLNREPSDREMANLVAQMYGDYRAEYDASVQAMRSEYDAQTRALESGEAQSAGTVQNVDPTARFREAFERTFANEIALNEDSDDFIERSARMQTAMGRLDAAIGF